MIRKTYGVSGLMDWTTQIKVGQAAVAVHFTGGALTAYGVTPAKYSTSNKFFQNVIENSDQFKSGRIELLGTMEVPGDDPGCTRKARPTAQTAETAETAAVGEQTKTVTESATNNADADKAALSKVEVADKNEAVEYLKEHFADKNYTATSLRVKAAFDAACKECGVEFVFTA